MRRLLLCVLAATWAWAPAAHAMSIAYGLHAGASIPDLRDRGGNELSAGYTSRFAPFGGVFAVTPLSPAFSLRLELNYAPQGGKRDGLQPLQDTSQFPVAPGTPLYARFKTIAKLDYLEFPLLLGYHFGVDRRFAVEAGPYGGILLSAKTVTSGTSPVYTDPQGTQVLTFPPGPPYNGAEFPAVDFGATTDNKSSLKGFNWGFQAGGGVAQALGPGLALLEVRGGLGLIDLQKSSADGRNATGVVEVALGYAWTPAAR